MKKKKNSEKKKKIERREIGVETKREEIVVEEIIEREKKDVEIATEVEEIVEDKREIELRE